MNRIATDIRRLALVATGGLLVSAACVAAAPADTMPMTPNAPLTVADWQAEVGAQLDANLRLPANALAQRDHLLTVVAVSFDRDGAFTGAHVARSSGSAAVDAGVVRTAGALAYPPLPAGYRGTPRTVLMQAYFGEAASPLDALRHEEAVKALASRPVTRHDATQTAALPGG